MKITKYNVCGCMLSAIMAFVAISCSDKDDMTVVPEVTIPSSIEFNLPENIRQLVYTDETGTQILPMVKGMSYELPYTIKPDTVTFKDVVWTSTNAGVATVDEGGTVKAVSGDGTGYSMIQVAPEAMYSGSGVNATLKVVVSNEMVPATAITISGGDELYAGETLQLSAAISPETSTYKTVKWISSNDDVASVDMYGLVTGKVNSAIHADVTITATSLDGGNVVATKKLIVNQIVQPHDISINQDYSVDKGYVIAIADKTVNLNYTTTPDDCTKSLIKWTSSDENIATVNGGVVSVNQNGKFGDVVITASCPETGKSSSVKLHVEEGLVRELFHNKDNYTWYNAKQSGNGTSSSHVWSYGKVTVTTYSQNATKQRADFKCWSANTWLNSANYPIIAIKMDDLKDMSGVTGRNITLDGAGSCSGSTFSGGLNGNNNQWLHDYKCSDGSHVFIYDLSTQKWANGGLLPAATATFTTLQFKYADVTPLTKQVQYNVYWVQTFKTLDDVAKYVKSEGLTYDVVK